MNGIDQISPLREQHLDEINRGLAEIARGRAQLELAKRAGIDVAAEELRINAAEESLKRIKAVYFPGR